MCTGDAEAFSAASIWRRRGRRPSQSASVEESDSPRTCCASTTRPFATRASTTHRVLRRPSRWRSRLSNLAVDSNAQVCTAMPEVASDRSAAVVETQFPRFPGYVQIYLDRVHTQPIYLHVSL